jgi:hypothetical protein
MTNYGFDEVEVVVVFTVFNEDKLDAVIIAFVGGGGGVKELRLLSSSPPLIKQSASVLNFSFSLK